MVNLSGECAPALANEAAVKKAVFGGLELLLQLAWGDRPPTAASVKQGWLSPADLNLYCQLKLMATNYYGQASWENFREKMMKAYNGADTLTRDQLWARSLLSINCLLYK